MMQQKEFTGSLKEQLTQLAMEFIKHGAKRDDVFESFLFVGWAAGLSAYRAGMPYDEILEIYAVTSSVALGLIEREAEGDMST